MAVFECESCGREIEAGPEVREQPAACPDCGEQVPVLPVAGPGDGEIADQEEETIDQIGPLPRYYAIMEEQRKRNRRRLWRNGVRISAWVLAGVAVLGAADFALRNFGWTRAVVDAAERSTARKWLKKNQGEQWHVVKWSPLVDDTDWYSFDHGRTDVLSDSVLYASATCGEHGPRKDFIFVFRLGKLVGAGPWKFPAEYDGP